MAYGELSARSNAVARELIAAGVGPESAVAICFERGPAMVVAIHAVLASGGCFVPVAPDSPVDRVGYVLGTAGVGVVLAAADDVDRVAGLVGAGVVVVGVDLAAAVDWSSGSVVVGGFSGVPVGDGERLGRLLPEHPAYTMFTSGSTGRPKGDGAASGVLATMELDRDFYGFTGRDVFAQVLDYTFDPSILEFVRPALVGAPLVLLAPGEHRDPQAMAARLGAHGVSVAVVVPSMLAVMVEVLGEDTGWASSLRVLCTGGEALAPMVAASVIAAWPPEVVYNQVWADGDDDLFHARGGVGSVNIRRPVPGMAGYVLDSRLQPVPRRVVGELYLGGVQTARGLCRAAGFDGGAVCG